MELFEKILIVANVILPIALLIWQLKLNRIALKEYFLTNSSTKALYKIKRWDTLRFIVKLLAGVFFLSYVAISIADIIESAAIFELILLFSMVLYLFFLDVVDSAITHSTYNTVRKIGQASLTESVVDIAKEYSIFFFSMLPIYIVIWSFRVENGMTPFNEFLLSVLRTFAIVAVVKAGEMIIPFILILFSKARRTRDAEIEKFAKENLPLSIYKKLKIYISPDTDAQAIVTDALFKKIVITNGLINTCSKDELKAILLHEFGHIKLNHLFKQSSRNLLVFAVLSLTSGFLVSGIIYLFIDYRFIVLFDIIGLALIIFLPGFLLYDILITRAAVSRKHEKEADEYVVKSGVEPQVLISALRKVHDLNDEPESLGKFEEKLSTHPSLENRIKYINEFAESLGKRKDV